MEYTKLSGSFGFDSKLDYGDDITFIGQNPTSGTWYVSMRRYYITLSITDNAGNAIFVTLSNEDYCLSGLEASLLIKEFYFIVKHAVNKGGRLNRKQLQSINGREVQMVWTNKKADE